MTTSPPSHTLTLSFLLALLSTLLTAALLRLHTLLSSQSHNPPKTRPKTNQARVLIVLGSGGHTHEMFYLLRGLDTRKYATRDYVVSSGDAFSGVRAREFEETLQAKRNGEEDGEGGGGDYTIHSLPRARRIHQPLYTTPVSALRSFVAAFPILLSRSPGSSAADALPDLVLANGPGTAVILVYAALLLRFFDIRRAESERKLRIVYVESFARVRTLSLSARLVGWCVDRFLVQWEGLEGKGGRGRGEFCGILV
ncbi:unnamed protein product [Periconia digitata]|uniref:UDP-N-acetylglucosamine transferase subunit ALG14 n=1 Tax=Periconia digitata TaxID=1303443 RepID=A0A9W4XUG0_9PLEO|nr:unnamed protein product [Periconia digitata]